MPTKKLRNRRHRTEQAQQARRDLVQKQKDRRRAVIDELSRKRAARETARMTTQETTLIFASSSKDSLIPPIIPTTSNPAAHGLTSIYTTINDLTDGGIIQSTFDDEYTPLEVPISPANSSTSVNLMQERTELEELEDHEPAFAHVYSDEGETEIDPDEPRHLDDHYPSDSEAGEDDNDEYRQEPEGESEMVVGMVDLVQGEQYLDQRAFEVEQPQQRARGEGCLPGLYKQKDIDVEVSVAPEKPFPSALVNISQENVINPFKTVPPSTASNSDIDTITHLVCFVVIALHFLAGLARSWCEFLLKAFIFLVEALGRPDIAAQIPSRLPMVLSYARVPSYHVTVLPVCPTCGDVFPVGYGAPIDCPRCSIPLFKEHIHPSNPSIPNPTCRVLVPRIRLPFLAISAQLERVFSLPGIEDEVDWWRTLNRQEGVYQDISDGKIWGEILDTEGKKFFRSVTLNGRKCAPYGELRIGVALAMDWYLHYYCFTALYSTNAYLGSMSPGVHFLAVIVLLH